MSLPLLASSYKTPTSDVNKDAVCYGDFVQSIYDSLNNDVDSEYYCFALYGKSELFTKVSMLDAIGKYTITRYIYSTVLTSDMPLYWRLTSKDGTAWVGYIAESTTEQTESLGYHDIVVAIRGTVAHGEWAKDFEAKQAEFKSEDASGAKISLGYVHKGFLSMYTSKDSSLPLFGDFTMKEQILNELNALIFKYKDEKKVRVTFVGHSLGAALATLAACDMGTYFSNSSNLTMSLFTFGSPRVGNSKFKSIIEKNVHGGIRRYTDKNDLVPKLPPPVWFRWSYKHAGEEIKVDTSNSPYIQGMKLIDILVHWKPHNLELYMHGVAANATSLAKEFLTRTMMLASFSFGNLLQELKDNNPECASVLEDLKEIFQSDQESLQKYLTNVYDTTMRTTVADNGIPMAKRRKLYTNAMLLESPSPWGARQYCLVNKSADILKDEYEIPKSWRVAPNKDMVMVKGEWQNRENRPADIPSYKNNEYN